MDASGVLCYTDLQDVGGNTTKEKKHTWQVVMNPT